jgi:hypothetical protein
MSNIIPPVTRLSSIKVTLDPQKILADSKSNEIIQFEKDYEEVTIEQSWLELYLPVPLTHGGKSYFYNMSYPGFHPCSVIFPDEETLLIFKLKFGEYIKSFD